jgi:hypothetical protein
MVFTFGAVALFVSCGGDPAPQLVGPVSTPRSTPARGQPPAFDPASISPEQKNAARIECQQLIQKLNSIIRARDYDAWVSYLDGEYFAMLNSPSYLEHVSKSDILMKQGISLKSAEDYFNHVVVPARANDRVDDIDFFSPVRVKAYTINQRGKKLRLYDLERTREGWKIIN